MRYIWFFLLVGWALVACAVQPAAAPSTPTDAPLPTAVITQAAPTASLQRISYAPSTADVPNPERGFYQGVELGVELSENDLSWYPDQTGNRLLYFYLRLDDFRRRDLTPEYLTTLSDAFALARRAGVKTIVRFSYNDGETYPAPAPDATPQQVVRHIEQLAPVLAANKDGIAWFEAGFIGAWGEWHTSANGLDSPENKALVRDALFAHFPNDRFILFRYPGDLTRWYPQPLSAAQAFTPTDQARAGHHNDCFLASDDDWGTYYDNNDDTFKIEEWKTYLAQMTQFVPMSGETCNPNPPRSDCATALAELERLHWTALNEEYHPAILQSWRQQGCYDEIRQRLGYRLSLLEANFPAQIRPGESLPVQIRLSNTGFASPLLLRPVYLVLAGAEDTLPLALDVDPRRWQPGEHTLEISPALPADLPPGTYQLALWLPDPAATLQADPRYAIRFANEGIWDDEHGWNVLGKIVILPRVDTPAPTHSPTPPALTPTATLDKWSLWTNGTQLRGANIWQRVRVPELDDDLLGDGYIGPPYVQADFDRLAAAGANYVNLSIPGIFSERPPYALDEGAQANLDALLEMAERAGLFAVLSFRTGPGRSDFTFYRDGAGEWFDPALLIETVWTEQAAQDAWVDMWRYTATRYRGQPVIVGYDLMVEPNADEVLLDLYDPDEFYPRYANTLYDWNQLYPRIVSAIRSVDGETPILISPMGWGSVPWLPYLQPVQAERIVYAVHQYGPYLYTHQQPDENKPYPGEFDVNWDEIPDRFDRNWLAAYLAPLEEFHQRTGAPIVVNEFGVVRWAPGAAEFLGDEIAWFEAHGINHALWVWEPTYEPWYTWGDRAMYYPFGPDPNNLEEVENDLWQVIQNAWAANKIRR